MAITLAGGCRVSEMREGTALVQGTLSVWPQVGREVGARAISLRILEFAPGISPGLRNDAGDEILYVEDNTSTATLFINGWPCDLAPQSGFYLRPHDTLTINNPGPASLVLISVRCPEPTNTFDFAPSLTSPVNGTTPPDKSPIINLADRPALPTAD